MRKTKVIQFEKNEDTREQARQILKNGIVNGMCVEKLIQLADINAFVGNVEVMVGLCIVAQLSRQKSEIFIMN